MIALVAAALLGAAQAPCTPPDGTDALLAMERRYIVVGELHGTTEVPAAFAQMVCAAAQRGPVTIALELPTVMQPQLDDFLAAPDEAAALAALEGTHFLNPRMNDGRSSRAMLDMMLSVRGLQAAGRDVAFHAFQPSTPRPPELSQAWYELDMGHALAGAAHARPQAKVLVLVGNLHARKTGFERFTDVGLPAVGHLPAGEVASLNVAQQGGSSWSCRASGCGPDVSVARYDEAARGIILETDAEGAYDGVLALGPVTASPPVVEDPGPPASAGSSS